MKENSFKVIPTELSTTPAHSVLCLSHIIETREGLANVNSLFFMRPSR